MSIFIDFSVNLGLPWDPLWAPFCDFSVIWGAKMGDCFQVHVFGDPGMEMMPECSVVNIVNATVLETFHFCHLCTNWCPGGWF